MENEEMGPGMGWHPEDGNGKEEILLKSWMHSVKLNFSPRRSKSELWSTKCKKEKKKSKKCVVLGHYVCGSLSQQQLDSRFRCFYQNPHSEHLHFSENYHLLGEKRVIHKHQIRSSVRQKSWVQWRFFLFLLY